MNKSVLLIFCIVSILNSNAQTYNGTGGAIPDNSIETCYPLDVLGVGAINARYGLQSVCINIAHTWDMDLEIKLKAPDGTIVNLSMRNGGGGDNYTNTCF